MRELSIDRSQLTFFDSSGLLLLLRLERRLADIELRFSVTPGTSAAADVLRIAGLARRFSQPT
ncbi:STAS domain-containing protein [Conexibacter sp. JD483]|uniref:STAS domain-containing protein n=1 Tax=unclassified Conexibacter TaxID=2627773 RepID=UPI0027222DBC|nr:MULTISPECIES: STAS domain-containing protein [unclassified Conexibacter]MDO8189256.1 STAS domain-containing protein [Conexibacter sp. CPCC 205706]MDO8198742.1 STAS domain-containing protein [Conexibacter sp. CPCC 205762]MDR9372129.1 STAS domain-containing protein [Conexibacter sp. JD483]